MNSIAPNHKINTYDDLQAERTRIEDAIKIQKMRIRHDIDELKAEAKAQFQPVVQAAEFVQKLQTILTSSLLNISKHVLKRMRRIIFQQRRNDDLDQQIRFRE